MFNKFLIKVNEKKEKKDDTDSQNVNESVTEPDPTIVTNSSAVVDQENMNGSEVNKQSFNFINETYEFKYIFDSKMIIMDYIFSKY